MDDRRDPVRGEDHRRARGDLGLAVDEDRAARLEVADDVEVVDDLLADVDGRPPELERLLDGVDRALDAGAVAARGGQEDPFHHRLMLPRGRSGLGPLSEGTKRKARHWGV